MYDARPSMSAGRLVGVFGTATVTVDESAAGAATAPGARASGPTTGTTAAVRAVRTNERPPRREGKGWGMVKLGRCMGVARSPPAAARRPAGLRDGPAAPGG